MRIRPFGRRAPLAPPPTPAPTPVVRDPGRPLAFMHVPKSAGTSFITMLVAALAPRAPALNLFDRSLFGAFDDFASIDDAIRARIHFSPDTMPLDADLICGHLAASTLAAAYPTAMTMTLLREPVTRLVSHWLFWRHHDAAQLSGWGAWTERVTLAQAPLADFLDDPRIACQTDNLATRLLLRPHALLPEDGFVDPAHDRRLLDEAAARLATFDFADIVESPTLEERLSRFLDRPAMLPRHNETPASRHSSEPPLHASLTPRTFDLLDARCRLDRALWLGLASREASTAEAERHAARVLAVGMARHGALLGR